MTSRRAELENLIRQFPQLEGRITADTTKAELIHLLAEAAEPEEEKVVFSTKLPKSLRDEFKQFAKQSPMNLQDLSAQAIREFLRNHSV